jgi:hypothetical protein
MSATSLTQQESISRYGTESYTGWGQTGADADFKAKGGQTGSQTSSSSGGGNSVESIVKGMQDYVASLINVPEDYSIKNPFSFDETLAKTAATAEYSPYYDQMLSDYTSTVERTKSRSQEDLTKTLDQLAAGKEYYMGTERRLLDRTIDNVNKGYAGQGLFFSGAKQKDINQINTEYGAQTGEYNRQYQYNVGQAQTAATRTSENIATASSMYSRDVGQAKTAAIEQGVLQRQSEAVQQYEIRRQKYYGASGYGVMA